MQRQNKDKELVQTQRNQRDVTSGCNQSPGLGPPQGGKQNSPTEQSLNTGSGLDHSMVSMPLPWCQEPVPVVFLFLEMHISV